MAKLKFRPLHDRVVVKRLDSEAKTKGGIIIPDTAKEKPQEGVIVALGTFANHGGLTWTYSLSDGGKRLHAEYVIRPASFAEEIKLERVYDRQP